MPSDNTANDDNKDDDKNKGTTAWPGLDEQAKGGSLQLDSGVVEDCANKCADLIAHILGVKKAIGENELDTLDNVSKLSSGHTLTSVFNRKGRELADTLDSHVKVLNDMADTFK